MTKALNVNSIYKLILKHPVLSLAIICMLCGVLGLSATDFISIPIFLLALVVAFVVISVLIIRNENDDRPKSYKYLKSLLIGAFFAFCFTFFVTTDSRAFFFGIAGFISLGAVAVYLYLKKVIL